MSFHLCAPPLIIVIAASDGDDPWGNLEPYLGQFFLMEAIAFSVVTNPIVQMVIETFFFLMISSSLTLPKNP